jgi:DNA-binding NarL/FixJ family response regulator
MSEAAPLGAPIRVLVVDDDLMVRETLCEYLATDDGLELVGVCENGLEAIDAVRADPPDVVLMDIRMPELDGIAATKVIVETAGNVKVVALTTFDGDEAISAFFQCGGAGFLLKNTRPAALVEAVRAAHRGLSVVPPNLINRWSPSRSIAEPPRLLPRERQVLDLLTRGLTNPEIARQLFVSPSTVKVHVASLMRKLDADNRTSLATRAHVLGLINTQADQSN